MARVRDGLLRRLRDDAPRARTVAAADTPCTARLRPDGVLVLGEGANPTTPGGLVWCLDFLFCAFDGWWDRSGFLTRWEWLALLDEADFRRTGYSVYRAGRFDLGGVVWGGGDGQSR